MLDDGGGHAGGELPWRLNPGARVAGFTIEGLISCGSFGTVYRARRDGRPFAIKLVPWNARGEREVDALRRVRHPNVVGFHGYGLWPDDEPRFLVLALELVEGRPLDVWAWEENPSALQLVEQVLLPLVETLEEVHAAGVVHRDLKEANIIMREADGQPVLVDFGSAGYEGAPRLTAVLPPGTPEYRSPEAVHFAQDSCPSGPYQASPGDDFWALGVTLYGLLTRVLPFGGRESPGMNRAILAEAPTPPHVLNPRVPPALNALCVRMLEKAPAARYADARQLKEALKVVLAEADDTWRVPLFPKGKRKKALASIPLAVSRASLGKRLWVASLILTSAVGASVLLLLFTPRSGPLAKALALQPTELPPPTPPHQVIPRQELASANVTVEVGFGAGLQKSPTTPAPVAVSATHSEEPEMMKSKTTRALTAATCLAGSACAGGPQHRPLPKPAECPPGAEETMRQLDIDYGSHGVFLSPFDWTKHTPTDAYIPKGEVTVETLGDWGNLPARSHLYGETFFGNGTVYGRFTGARLPNGGIAPICMQLRPIKMRPGSTEKIARVPTSLTVEPVDRFE